MSIESMVIALHHSRAKGTAKLVLLGIASHDGDGGAWPSRATLAKYAGIRDQNTIRKAVNQLIELHEVRRHINQGGTADRADYLRPNRYEFLLTCPPHCDRTPQHRDTRRASRYLPRYLDIPDLDDPEANETPGSVQTPDPASIQTGEGASGETPELNPLKPATGTSGTGVNAGARADEEVRSAPDLPESPSQPPCPARRGFMPCSYGPDHICIDCGGTEPLQIAEAFAADLKTGEVA